MNELVERLRKGADDASLDCYAMCEEAAARIEALEAALRDAFMAMCAQRDTPDDEVFQDAIDALGIAALDPDAEK